MRLPKITVIFAVLILAGLGFFIYLAYEMMKKKHAKEAEDSIFITSKSNLDFDVWYNLYSTFASIGITKHYLESLHLQFEILNPDNEKEVKEKAVKTAIAIWTSSIVILFVMLVARPRLFTLLCAIWLIYVLSTGIMKFTLEKSEVKLLDDFGKFVSEVRHNYFQHGMVDEAIYETFDKLSGNMQAHAIKIYNTVIADDIDEAIFKYNRTAPNNYMKQFLSICIITILYGDKHVDGQSLFLMDIKDLKSTLDDEILNRKNIKAKFAGLPFTACAPAFVMDFIRDWAIDTVPELQKFYNGTSGILILIAAFVMTFVIYWVIDRLRTKRKVDRSEHPFLVALSNWRPVKKFIFNFEEANFTKTYKMKILLKRTGSSMNTQTFLLHRLIKAIIGAVFAIVLIIGLTINQVNLALNDVSEMAEAASGAEEEVNVSMMVITKYYIDKFKDADLVHLYNQAWSAQQRTLNSVVKTGLKESFAEQLKSESREIDDEFITEIIRRYNVKYGAESKLYTVYLGTYDKPSEVPDDVIIQARYSRDFGRIKNNVNKVGGLKGDYNYTLVANAIVNHLVDYNSARLHWWYVLVVFLFAAIGYNLPVAVLKFSEQELQDFMEDEVVQFQSVIMILMYIERMTVQTILEEMDKFAFCFEESIQTCINNLSAGEQEALQELWAAEPFEPFQRLVENLMSVDKIGVRSAFNEIDIERKNYIEKRKQEGAIKLSNKHAICETIAFLPSAYVITVYMVVPFITEATSSLTENLSQLK